MAKDLKPGPLLIGIDGLQLDETSRSWLLHPQVGGVVLFSRNFESREQVTALVMEMRELRSPRLLIAIDQEGGRVQRLREGFTALPPLGVLGKIFSMDPELAMDYTYRHARVMAAEMLACGIDLSFAPVLDLDRGSRVIGDRSFSGSTDVVVSLGRAYLAGMHDAGMKTTGKHFPGHGSVLADSHVDDVCDDRSLQEIEASDLVPFRELGDELDALMIAHVVYPQVDELPAGYSKRWLQDYLRKTCGYQGVIFSDDLGMQAALVAGSLNQRIGLCLDAGCDLVLVCQPTDVAAVFSDNGSLNQSCTSATERLYSNPGLSQAELDGALTQGAGEWRQWQQSLADLNRMA